MWWFWLLIVPASTAGILPPPGKTPAGSGNSVPSAKTNEINRAVAVGVSHYSESRDERVSSVGGEAVKKKNLELYERQVRSTRKIQIIVDKINFLLEQRFLRRTKFVCPKIKIVYRSSFFRGEEAIAI